MSVLDREGTSKLTHFHEREALLIRSLNFP